MLWDTMVPPERFELPTPCSEDKCSNPLSYGGIMCLLYQYFCYNLFMNMKNIKNALIGMYIFLLVGGYFYVPNVLKHTEINEIDKDKETIEDTKPVKVTLIVEDLTSKQTFELKLTNKDSVNDLLENARDTNKIFFEKTRYIYGNELEKVNNKETPIGYHWKLFLNDSDITYKMDDLKLTNNTTYYLKLIKQN